MKAAYADWISTHFPDHSSAYGKCAEATETMVNEFPELRRVRGHYHCPVWGERTHWWLVAEDGTVVDPTRMQFPSRGIGEYVEWVEGTPEPTGRCANCGDGLCYNGDTVCSDQCGNAYAAYLNSEVSRGGYGY